LKRVVFMNTDFMLVAESNLPATELPNLGTFQLMPGDAMSKFRYSVQYFSTYIISNLLFIIYAGGNLLYCTVQ
jgi:hypothetical protein